MINDTPHRALQRTALASLRLDHLSRLVVNAHHSISDRL